MGVSLPATGPRPPVQDALAEVVEELTKRLKAGGAADLDACLAAHPEHAAELRRLLPALQLLADLSRSPGAALPCPVAAAQDAAETRSQLGDFRLIREVGRGGMGGTQGPARGASQGRPRSGEWWVARRLSSALTQRPSPGLLGRAWLAVG
jgi:hypothetical protein